MNTSGVIVLHNAYLYNATSNGIKSAFARFLETFVITLLSRRPADEVTSEVPKLWPRSDKLMHAIVIQLMSSALFIHPVDG